ncbi:Kinesin motor domain containing protein [Musa troglodytarum]|uniref:Kinesin motor domain containing protein n=1 Tax=Musa troglodytarum TaxID=320322 RepID=A0A9E7H6N7_9LILI|nr:Kinesin motor domain containing protein [Musa troglodytarum]
MKALANSRGGRVPSSETLTTPSSQKQRPPRAPKENVDPNTTPPESSPFKSPGKPLSGRNRSPLPPKPPLPSFHGGNPLKRKLSLETLAENGGPPSMSSDSGVQVLVRVRPPSKEEEEGDPIDDIFRLVGLPLVENCLAGFNSSIFAYGQIREDVKAGIYVDCLTEEYVYTMKDVIRLLTKGLANRRTGATSVNMESSRSHCVFTCIVDSQSKDELLRMKSNGSAGNNGSFSSAWNARRSLNLLKMSLNCPTTLAILKDDSDVEMEIDESDAEMPYIQASQPLPCEGKLSVDLSASKEELRSSINDNDTVARDARSICKMDPGCAKDQTFAVEDCAVKKIGPGQLIVNSDGGSAGDRRDDQLNDTCEIASQDENEDTKNGTDLQLVPIDGTMSADKLKMKVPRLRQYKHERECSAIIAETREDKISRLESLMDGILPTEEFMEEEFAALMNEHKLLKEKYENHPEIMWLNIELKRVQEELDESTEASGNEKIEPDGCNWTERESEWIILSEELKLELEASRSLAEKRKVELDSEKKCTEELKEALQTAMQGHARILEQYADLQEKHIGLLSRHRKIMDGIEDVKKAAARAGVKGAESKFINSLAAEISALRADREKERQYWRDENRGLQVQLRDTAEAVQAAGELLVRLKETEEAVATAAKRACMAEQETEKAYQEIDNLKKNYDREISLLNQLLAESRFPREARTYTVFNDAKTGGESLTDQRWREEFEPFCNRDDADFSKDTNPGSWFSGYDRCNI